MLLSVRFFIICSCDIFTCLFENELPVNFLLISLHIFNWAPKNVFHVKEIVSFHLLCQTCFSYQRFCRRNGLEIVHFQEWTVS